MILTDGPCVPVEHWVPMLENESIGPVHGIGEVVELPVIIRTWIRAGGQTAYALSVPGDDLSGEDF